MASFLVLILALLSWFVPHKVSIFQVTFMPETSNSRLPDLIEDGENLGSGDSLWSGLRCCKKKARKDNC